MIDPNDPQAIAANLAGVNPSATFLAVVSCLAADGTTHNVFSDPFPATTGLGGGDAKVEVQLTLPQPCIAPIVFVTSPAGRALVRHHRRLTRDGASRRPRTAAQPWNRTAGPSRDRPSVLLGASGL